MRAMLHVRFFIAQMSLVLKKNVKPICCIFFFYILILISCIFFLFCFCRLRWRHVTRIAVNQPAEKGRMCFAPSSADTGNCIHSSFVRVCVCACPCARAVACEGGEGQLVLWIRPLTLPDTASSQHQGSSQPLPARTRQTDLRSFTSGGFCFNTIQNLLLLYLYFKSFVDTWNLKAIQQKNMMYFNTSLSTFIWILLVGRLYSYIRHFMVCIELHCEMHNNVLEYVNFNVGLFYIQILLWLRGRSLK